MTALADAYASPPLRPAAPRPPARRLKLLPALRLLNDNPIAAFAEEAYAADFLEIGRGRGRTVLVNEPAAIERTLVHNAANYRKSFIQQRPLKPALRDGLLTAEGAAWRSARRVVAPLFSPKAVADLADDMRVSADAMVERWRARTSTAEPMDLSAEFQRLTYEIVSRTVFSGALDEDRARIHANMALYFDTLGRVDVATVLGLPAWWPKLANLKARPALKVFRGVIERVVSERSDVSRRADRDLLDRLLSAPDPTTGALLPLEAVSDNVLTFLAAGHETTGNALAWIVYLLSLFPEAGARMRDELRGFSGAREDMDRLVFSRAVVNEAMRLYPPAPFIGREAIEDDVLGPVRIRKGDQVLMSPWILHRRHALWEAPNDFAPERFMGDRGQAIPRGAFIPFGLGPRICVGQGFATQEILIVLARVLTAFDVRLAAPEAVVPQARITLKPRDGMPAFVTPR